jgi:hypothetical protein
MIATTKLIVLMAAMTLVGAGGPLMAAAQVSDVDIVRHKEITQVIHHEEVCTTNESELVASEGNVSSQLADVDTTEISDCMTTQTHTTETQSGGNTASTLDYSSNVFDIPTALIADFF